MFIDASAIVAILTRDAGFGLLIERMEAARHLLTSGLSVLEAVLALHRVEKVPIPIAQEAIEIFLKQAVIALVPLGRARDA